MAVVTRNNTLLLVGGRDSTVFLNDVWASEDGGVTWARRGSQPPFEPRGYHTLVVTSSGCVVLAAGQNFRAFFNDVWTSCDEGHSWRLLSPAGRNDSGIFSARAGAAKTSVVRHAAATDRRSGWAWCMAGAGSSTPSMPRPRGP